MPKGAYAVVFELIEPFEVEVGSHGTVQFTPETYAYIGSAFGQGGLGSRLSRHYETAIGETESTHWHIDYILEREEVLFVGAYAIEDDTECDLANYLSSADNVEGVDSLGASDCDCETHVFRGSVVKEVQRFGLTRFVVFEEREFLSDE